jgi:NAD(P)-dependent dehydrogenase (short-subunit alcohol dehydrogenase family)
VCTEKQSRGKLGDVVDLAFSSLQMRNSDGDGETGDGSSNPAVARVGIPDESPARPRRNQLCGLRAAARTQSAAHRRRQRHGPRGGDCLCPRGRRCSDQLSSGRGIRREGRKAIAVPGDIRDEGFCRTLVERAAGQLGGLDILVNNAARQVAQASILDITSEQFDATFKTNVYAMFWITKAALPHMSAGATIINTASVNAYDPEGYILDYAATKGAIAIFTKALAKQVAKQGIRVNAVAPGPIWTPLQPSGGQLPGKLPEFGADTPLGRPGQPAEVAPLYVLLASRESSFSTGQVFGAVGGRGGP